MQQGSSAKLQHTISELKKKNFYILAAAKSCELNLKYILQWHQYLGVSLVKKCERTIH
jgi:hypothetical protein